MPAAKIVNHCGECRVQKPVLPLSGKTGFVSGLLLALLPKCPFCVMAFTSTFVVCGTGGTNTTSHTFSSTPTIIIAGIFCTIALLSVAFNYKKNKTPKALLVVGFGVLAIIISTTFNGGLLLYYLGTILMFFGVWYNGNMMHFVKKYKLGFQRKNIKNQTDFLLPKI